jgi:hypothetical protein
MCRQGGYFAQAAYLATKHGEHDLVVTILIEDSKKYAEALQYIWRLEPATVGQLSEGFNRRRLTIPRRIGTSSNMPECFWSIAQRRHDNYSSTTTPADIARREMSSSRTVLRRPVERLPPSTA